MDKLIIEFESCFWEKDKDWIMMITPKIGEWGVAFNMIKILDRPVLMFFLVAAVARKFKSFTDDELLASCMETVNKMYPEATQPVKWLRTNWEDNPFARQSYSFVKVGQTLKDFDTIFDAKPM
jgi:monoamine oxidase